MTDLAISLLTPPDHRNADAPWPIDEQTSTDLGFGRILDAMVTDRKRVSAITAPAGSLCRDAATIEYRLDVLEDLLGNEELIACVEALLPRIERLRFYVMHPGKTDATPLQEAVWRIRELENYVACIDGFHAAFRSGSIALKSTGLVAFRRVVDRAAEEDAFSELRAALPSLLDRVNGFKSLTIGVNLNEGLVPIEATVLSVNREPFRESGFLGKMASRHGDRAIGRLHSAKESEFHAEPLMIPLFRDVARMLNESMRPLSRALKRFGRINGSLFVRLIDEFVFYLGAARLVRTLRSRGLPMTRPKILPHRDRVISVRGLYNVDLALAGIAADQPEGPGALTVPIVKNDFSADSARRIFILTGPNSGGKTTFLQAVGLVQLLAQIGLFVPADRAEISLCDGVFTHYPNLEDPGKDSGRFGEEADRLREIFARVTGESLFLLNETLSSTSMGEALYLAEDLLAVLARIGTRTIFVTHLHQLAADRGVILGTSPDECPVESLVAGVAVGPDGTSRPSFVVRPGEPLGKSYANELAVKHGISRAQLEAMVARSGCEKSSELPVAEPIVG